MRRYTLLIFIVLISSELVIADLCEVELKSLSKGIDVRVETCRDIGTFSIGGLYDGDKWERLTYMYPKPWEGTFLSLKVNNLVYTNSMDSGDKIFLDPYIEKMPIREDDKIYVSWSLPENILVEQTFELIDNGVRIKTEMTNKGNVGVDVGARLHIDTMLGENDGAPIYIPGDGLKSMESEYSGTDLDFEYWKAYNRATDPSVISTGILDGKTYPDKVIVACWKKSMYSSWDYRIDPSRSILGDSSVILYYDTEILEPGRARTIVTSYMNGEPVLPASKNIGISAIVPNERSRIYCPGSLAIIKVDVINKESGNEGQLGLEIRDEDGNLVYGEEEHTGLMGADSSKTIQFRWQTPRNISPTSFEVLAILQDIGGKELDRDKTEVIVDYTLCTPPKGEELNWSLILIPLFLILFAVFIFVFIHRYSQMGDVEIRKEKDGEHVKVTVWNRTKREIKNCVIEDIITEGAEVDISTAGVERKGNELIWRIGTLESDDKAILEYRIKEVEFLPPAAVRWDSGESVSK